MGSAVAIGSGLLLTNAHVIFDKDQTAPNGFYEICRTLDFRKKPVCFTTGDLLSYDETSDLALLRFAEPTDLPTAPLFQENKLNIWADLVIYGYPGIGGDNISRTEGNVAGYEDPYYKVDGAIDHGSSWGGAFNKNNELIGIPSRVSSDNAVIGFMIPITTIRNFLAKKTKWYTKWDITVPQDFKDFIRISELGERSKDVINDSNIKTQPLKKFGLKYSWKLDGLNSFLYGMSFTNLEESSVLFGCSHIWWALSYEELTNRDAGEGLKKYKETKITLSGASTQYHVSYLESLVSKDKQDVINIYNTKESCVATIQWVNIEKDMKLINKAVAFITSGITTKKPYLQTSGFDTQIFRIGTIPAGISIKETPGRSGNSSIVLGYFGQKMNTGETLENLNQKKKDTIDNYFLGSSSYLDNSPGDVNLKPEDYSYETFRKLYEKKYTGKWFSDTNFIIADTKNSKKIIIGTTTYKDPDGTSPSTDVIIVSYPYMIKNGNKTEYYELTYSTSYEWKYPEAMSAIKDFFTSFEPIGVAPF